MKIALIYVMIQVLLVLGICAQVRAESIVSSDEAMHLAAHAGTSYALTHVSEVVCTKIAGKEHKTACTIVGASVAATAGLLKEVVVDRGESTKRHAIGYTEDALGIGAAVLIISIDF